MVILLNISIKESLICVSVCVEMRAFRHGWVGGGGVDGAREDALGAFSAAILHT